MVHAGHFGDAARVVHDRAVRVRRNDHPADGEHPHRADADPVNTGYHAGCFRNIEGNQGRDHDPDDGGQDAQQAVAETSDDGDGRAGAGNSRGLLHRFVFFRGEIFGRKANHHTHDQANQRGPQGAQIISAQQNQRDDENAENDAGDDGAEVERCAGFAVLAHPHKLDADQ